MSLDAEMTIHRAADLKQTVLGVLAGPAAPVELDLAGVTELDSAGVQLLLLVRTLARARQQELRVVACSAAARQVLSLLNLTETLAVAPDGAAGGVS